LSAPADAITTRVK
jgi:beta-glucosidase